jgi:hypothetical protein
MQNVANVALGYKSLQNDFFYVNEETIKQFEIEEEFLQPIFMLGNLAGEKYWQTEEPKLWLFLCRDKEADLRGTGALRYIEAMGDRAAKVRKQAGKRQTVREALAAQGGGLWYAPKAQPHEHHIWLRKGISGVFAPLIFEEAVVVDQRCNSVSPKGDIAWRELAGAMTSTLFAYSVEINGSMSMGAGVLEAPTTKLRDYPILDVRGLSHADRETLTKLAEAVWLDGNPMDWGDPTRMPSERLAALDDWILSKTTSGVKLDELHADMRAVCQQRMNLAKDKVTKTKTRKTTSIGGVASAIASRIRPKIQSRGYPEDFINKTLLDIPINVSTDLIHKVVILPLLGSATIEVTDAAGDTILKIDGEMATIDAVARALLMGRSSFSVSSDKKSMAAATTEFLKWIGGIQSDIEQGIQDSALGTGYEDALRDAVYRALLINHFSMQSNLPLQITLPPR